MNIDISELESQQVNFGDTLKSQQSFSLLDGSHWKKMIINLQTKVGLDYFCVNTVLILY